MSPFLLRRRLSDDVEDQGLCSCSLNLPKCDDTRLNARRPGIFFGPGFRAQGRVSLTSALALVQFSLHSSIGQIGGYVVTIPLRALLRLVDTSTLIEAQRIQGGKPADVWARLAADSLCWQVQQCTTPRRRHRQWRRSVEMRPILHLHDQLRRSRQIGRLLLRGATPYDMRQSRMGRTHLRQHATQGATRCATE
jgi:hypothetical protein